MIVAKFNEMTVKHGSPEQLRKIAKFKQQLHDFDRDELIYACSKLIDELASLSADFRELADLVEEVPINI